MPEPSDDRISLHGPSFRDVLKATLEVKPPAKDKPNPKAAGTVGQQIAEKRQALKWSRAKLAREAGVNVQTVRLIEEGRARPKESTLAKIATRLALE